MKIYTSLLMIIAILFSGCIGNQPRPGPTGGVTYTCPGGWSITDEVDYGRIGHYSACKKEGKDSSGVFILSWFGREQRLNELLGDMQNNLKTGYSDKGVDIRFSEPEDAVFRGYDALVSDYSFSLEKIGYRGKIIAFRCGGKGIVILSQEAEKDHDRYLADFEGLGDSIKCDSGG